MVKKNKTSKDGKIIQNVNIKIGDSKTKKTKRRRTTTKKQAKPPMSNFQYPQPILIQQQPQQLQREQIRKDENISKQIQLKFDEEYAKRENEKATKKQSAVPGAFQSVDDGNGFSQEVSRMNKTFVNNSSSAQTARLEPENIYQRSNLLNEIKNTPIKAEPVLNNNLQVLDATGLWYCEVCQKPYAKSSKSWHLKENKTHKKLLEELKKNEYEDMPPLEPIPEPPKKPNSTIPTPDTIQKLSKEFDDIDNKVKRETYLNFANKIIERKNEDNETNKINLKVAERDPNSQEAMNFKKEAFNKFKDNNRYMDEVENQFQNVMDDLYN